MDGNIRKRILIKLKKPLIPGSNQNLRETLVVLSVLFLWLTLRCCATISSQVSAIKSNIFEINSLRFGLEFLGILPFVMTRKYSLIIARKHIWLLLAAMIFNTTFATCISVAPSFMPVGSMDALFLAFFIIFSMLYDLLRGSIGKKAVLTSFVVAVGIILVAQPWETVSQNGILSVTPCMHLDSRTVSVGQSNTSLTNMTSDTSDNSTTDSVHTVPNSTFDYNTLIGYILVIAAGIGSTAAGNCVKKLVEDYPIPSIIFWLSMLETVLFMIINLALTRISGSPFYSFPNGKYCIVFTGLFVVTAAVAHLLSYFVYSYLYISTIAVASVYISIVLYISQRTYLKAFHPGHANITEVFGITIVIFGASFLPLLFGYVEKKIKMKSSYCVEWRSKFSIALAKYKPASR